MDPLNEATTDDGPLTLSEGLAAYTQASQEADEGQSEDISGEEGEPLETEAEAPEGEEAEGEEQTDEEGQPDDEEAGDEEDDAEEVGGGKFAADDAKVKMPDGTYLTIAQLKSGNLMDRDYRQKTMALSEERKTFEAKSQAVEQAQQQIQTERDYLVQLLKSIVPEPPKAPTVSASADPLAWIQYQEQLAQYQSTYTHLEYIQQQQESTAKELTAKQQEERQQRVQNEYAALLEKAPELSDPARVKAFEADMFAAGAEYGFTPEDIVSQVPLDHRMALVLRDAMAWRKLQANKTAQKDKLPTPPRPPVQKGGRRQTPGNIQAREVKSAMERLNKSGSLRDGIAAALALQKQG